MSSKMLTVIKFEYLQTVRRIGFWLGTLLFPVFIAAIMAISAWSSLAAAQSTNEILQNSNQTIVVIDRSGVINPEILTDTFEPADNLDNAVERVKKNEIKAVFYLPENFVETKNYQVFAQDQGLFNNFSYQSIFDDLISRSVLSRIETEEAKQLYQGSFNVETAEYFDVQGNSVKSGFSALILPILSFLIFFMAVFISAQYLLQSVAEEKENRMIETILSVLDSRTLIFGKIIGLSMVVLTQLGIWLLGGLAIGVPAQSLLNTGNFINLDGALEGFSLGQVLVSLVLTLLGFLLFSAIMVGVGSVASNYKDSQNLSAFFIISAVFPMYFITALLSDPTGGVAQFFSYFPTTSAFVLLLRNSLGELSILELAIGLLLNILYVGIAFWIAAKLFDLGILMYNRKPTLKEIWSVLTAK